jgi:trehalose-6-phosphate synthase
LYEKSWERRKYFNENNGVLVLSTGRCYEEFKRWSICINPYDIRQTAESLEMALLMDDKSKSVLLNEAKAAIRRNDLNKWVSDQLRDIEAVIYERQEIKSKDGEEAVRMN